MKNDHKNRPLDSCIGNPMAEEECVTVKEGHQVIIKKGNGEVTIYPSFNCKKGAVFEVK